MFELFRRRMGVEEVMAKVGLARSTVMEYLATFVRLEKPPDLGPWVDEVTFAKVRAAARQVGAERLKPIFLALNEKVPYDQIRLVIALMPQEQQT
jgi:ATP-dependent DNA helicase RecQ